jgi:hypothetical protein
LEYERSAVLAVSSIYGIDILEDNVIECRKRLFAGFDRHYASLFPEQCLNTVKYILERNIIWGDALTLKTAGEDPQPIIFSEWSFVKGNMIKRKDFAFQELLHCANMREEPLFSDLGERAFRPTPIKEFPLVHFLRLAHANE